MIGTAKQYLGLVLGVVLSLVSHADVFHCKDKNGKSIFQDSECAVDQILVKKDANVQPDNVATFSEIELGALPDGQQVVYQGSLVGNETRYLRVSIFEQTEKYIIFEVEGYFSGQPAGQLEFRATPNIPWSSNGFVTAVKPGLIKDYSRIGLNSKSDAEVDSDIISLQLWHYSPEKKATFLGSKTIPFKKHWVK